MKINRENYEQYFIDYLDGNLSDQEIIMLKNFLLLNPEYRNELEGLERVILKPDENPYPEKDLLRQPDLSLPVNEDNFDDFCVAAIEGDLNEDVVRDFQNYLDNHPEKLNEYLIYKQVYLVPDKNIVFPLKGVLKKPIVFHERKFIYYAVSIAAALALVFIIIKQNNDIDNYLGNTTVAENPVKLETPVVHPQIINQLTTEVPIINKTSKDSNKPDFQQTAMISAQVPDEKKTEVTNQGINEKIRDEIKKSELQYEFNPLVEIIIPMLTENDVIISKSDIHIQFVEPNIVTSSGKYLSIAEYARKELNEKVLRKKEDNLSRISLLDMAGAGIKGFNRLTGSRMKLEKKTNIQGEPDILAFESKLFSFSKPLNPKE